MKCGGCGTDTALNTHASHCRHAMHAWCSVVEAEGEEGHGARMVCNACFNGPTPGSSLPLSSSASSTVAKTRKKTYNQTFAQAAPSKISGTTIYSTMLTRLPSVGILLMIMGGRQHTQNNKDAMIVEEADKMNSMRKR